MTATLATSDALRSLAPTIAAAPWIALDTEFHAERRYHPRLYLVQVLVPGAGIHLIDPLQEGCLEAVADALKEPTWIVHAGRQDLRVLYPALGGIPERVIDTQIAAGLVSPTFPGGYSDLVSAHLGIDVEKAATLSDWSRRPLGTEQLHYAAEDVRLLPDLWEALQSRLRELGRTEIAEAAFAEARARALDLDDPERAWLQINATDVLDPPALRVVRALTAWRELQGREKDQPARSVLSDGLVVDLARRQPNSVNRILTNRRFPRRLAQRLGPELVQIVQTALRDPSDPPARIRRQSEEERAHHALRAAVAVAGAQASWSQRLVLPDRLLEEQILARTRGIAPRPIPQWRRNLAGRALDALLEGTQTLSIRDARAALNDVCSK